jgi:FKBP-type peptidyl-prolyl cis-trans isomerase FkpA
MTKKYFIILALPVFILFACSKSTSIYDCATPVGTPSTSQLTELKNYITSKGITATEDSRGFYYSITNPGYGLSAPTSATTVQVKYRGTLPDGTAFDSTKTGETAIISLGGTILGWQYGIPLIKKAGIIDLYLPPSLAYGCTASGKIPASSMLIFHVELINY